MDQLVDIDVISTGRSTSFRCRTSSSKSLMRRRWIVDTGLVALQVRATTGCASDSSFVCVVQRRRQLRVYFVYSLPI